MFDFNISNYRSFLKQDFKFSKINIFIGENSSGKSSLFKLLLALKQTHLLPANRELNLAFTGEYADLGSYKEAVYYQKEKLPITISFSFGEDYHTYFANFLGPIFKANKNDSKILETAQKRKLSISFTFTKDLDKHHTIKTQITNDGIGVVNILHKSKKNEIEEDELFGTKCTIHYIDQVLNTEFHFGDVDYEKDGFNSLINGSSLQNQIRRTLTTNKFSFIKRNSSVETKEIAKLVQDIFARIAYLLVVQNYLRLQLKKIDYINPIDTHPSRIYLAKDDKQSTTIKGIEDVVDFFGKSANEKATLDEFNSILKSFGIAEKIEIIVDRRLPVRELRVKNNDLVSNILDVGYGVSLQLPIILKAFLADRVPEKHNSIIMLEQPEVHLHPRLHAKLIETLVSLSNNTTYFIETHSEHIIRKLQVLVKEKRYDLSPEDVTIHYLSRKKKMTEVTVHKINEIGQLVPNIPSGFFDNSYLLAKQLLD